MARDPWWSVRGTEAPGCQLGDLGPPGCQLGDPEPPGCRLGVPGPLGCQLETTLVIS